MAEQDTDQQHTSDVKEGETQSTNLDHISALNECKQETDNALNVKQQLSEDSALSPASTNDEINDNGEDTEPGVKNCDSVEGGVVAPPEGSSLPEEDTSLNVKDNSTPPTVDEESHGDYKRETQAEEISRESHRGEKAAAETAAAPKDDQVVDQVDGNEEDANNTNTEAGEDDESSPEKDLDPEEEKDLPEDTTSSQTKGAVETIGPNTQESVDAEQAVPVASGNLRGSRIYLIVGIFMLVVAILVSHLQHEPPPQKDDVRQIDIFLGQLEKVKTRFPNQRAELWHRSKIHLLRHLQTAQPTEPVSLILTAGHGAERTLRCLAQSLASAFSSALNASVLHIDGASKASQDSDQVKLDIDRKLQGAFEGDKPVAVINRFEELPPGSTLIFYRYCDHENAAYKKTCLIFTVLLGEEEEIPAETRLSTVEEMVDDHLQKKFLSDGRPVSFDRMDLDKYGGLWSRISHLILPVAVDRRIEHDGCWDT